MFNLQDYEKAARQLLDPGVFAFVAGGACDEVTLRENRAAFDRWRLLPRVLVDVSAVDTSTTLLGRKVSVPVVVAPSAAHGDVGAGGEVATARGAAAAGVVMCLSSASSRSAGEVAAAAGDAPRWFQLYCNADRGVAKAMLDLAAEHGFEALVLTVDVPVAGRRESMLRSGFMPSPMPWFEELVATAGGGEASIMPDPALTWHDLAWIAEQSPLPLLLKGVLAVGDAVLAAEHGVAGIVLSNHGGRKLDSVVTGLDVLPGIADAVGDRLEVLIDGGVRRGTDVVKALALGARAVLVGRPVVYGLAVGGEAGVEHVLGLLREELKVAMALLGTPTVEQIGPDHLVRVG